MPSVLSFTTPATPITPVLASGNFTAQFNVTATFQPDTPGGSCAALVYRQYLYGSYTVDGVTIPHYLCQATNIVISPTVPQEDGCPPVGSNCTGASAYGYRQCNMTNQYYSNPDQATGANFWMSDTPGFYNVQPGHIYGLNLNFNGQIQNAGATLSQANWQVLGSATTPPTATPPSTAGGCTHNETPVGLSVADHPDGGRVAILSLARDAGAPAVDTAAVKLRLFDRLDRQIQAGPATAHEIGDGRAATAHLIHALPADAAPVKGLVSMDGVLWGELPAFFI
ncbi:hypothetical protein [Caulobacter segnis]|uniref:hypothetical protein n=1 Tax=Caulobacter segnis TaxID=88688 RepID=UPI001CBC055A|nr:hypothetical protein [Caulobacter segnis]UAL09043.1 hypothetical protein K8940_14710 [Caulobacter segnis]